MKPPTTIPRSNYSILPRHSACLVCRKRKEKCDGNRPECCECVAGNRKCQYEDEAYKTSTQILRGRIKELETQIREVEEKQGVHLSILTSQGSTNGSEGLFRGLSPSLSYSPSSSGQSCSSVPLSHDMVFPGQASFPSTRSSAEIEPIPVTPNQPWPLSNVIEGLLEVFLRRHAQCGFELHMGRVIQSLQPGAPEPMIPALFNAMLLVGCYFVQDDSMKTWESTLLERAKLEIETNVTRAHGGGKDKYNSLYHLQAMIMLGTYYYFKGRLLEGHVCISQATRFAVALGIHQLNSRIYRDKKPNEIKGVFGTERWCPRDSIELGEAINVWWSCFAWDTDGSALNGLPSSVSFEDITTVWPRPISDFESGGVLPDDDYSTASFLDPELSDIVADTSGDSLQALLAKANTLMHLGVKLDLERRTNLQGTEAWWKEFEHCDRLVNRFMQTMPPVRMARNIEELVSLVGVHTYMYCGEVQLHCALAEYEHLLGSHGDPRCIQPDGTLGGISYVRCVEACRAASLAALLVADIDMSYMRMFIGIGWICVSEVVARDVPRLRQSGRIAQAEERERQWEVVEKCMEQLMATYPVLSLQVEQLRDMKRNQILRLSGKA